MPGRVCWRALSSQALRYFRRGILEEGDCWNGKFWCRTTGPNYAAVVSDLLPYAR